MHVPVLVATIALALSAALVFGFAASRLRLSPIVGYLLAGIAVGPHTPGLVADAGTAADLAEIGVALLMFGVGLHFSPRDLAQVRSIAIPGAVAQSAVATILGCLIGMAWGWGFGAGLVFGLALSVASTVVLVRGLVDHSLLTASSGRAAVGWLIVEDLLTVIVLVLLPPLAASLGGVAQPGVASPWIELPLTLLKVTGLVLLVLVAGRRAVPWLLERVARTQSRELFTLAVLGLALGIACVASWLTGVSLALGAFLGGMVVGQSDLSHQAAADSIPLRDAFAVLFFVSVGMLFEPRLLLDSPGLLAAAVAVVVIAKPAAALLLVVALGHPLRMGLTVAAGLAQIGEFSFIMARVGGDLGLLPDVGHDVILAAALVSITLNPLLFRLVDPLTHAAQRRPRLARMLSGRHGAAAAGDAAERTQRKAHVVLCGSGRVGTVVARVLSDRGWQAVIVESDRARAAKLRERDLAVVDGDAGSPAVLALADVSSAALLVISYADPFGTRLTIDHARRLNPDIPIVARVDGRSERDHLEAIPGVQAVMGEFETAAEISRRALIARGTSTIETEAVILELRRTDRGESASFSAQLLELPVAGASRASGRALKELDLPPSTRVVLVRRGDDELVARGDTILAGGDRLLLLSDPRDLQAVRELLA